MFRTLWRYRELILSLVKRDLKTRYKSSALGFFWSLCKPLFIMAILFIVFVAIVPLRFEHGYFIKDQYHELSVNDVLLVVAPDRVDSPEARIADGRYRVTPRVGLARDEKIAFGVHLCIGILIWYFFTGALLESTGCVLANGALVKKVKIPAEVFPVATVLSNLVHLLLAFAVLIPFMLLLGYRLTWMVLLAPPLIALLVIWTTGLAFLLSATNVFYRDVTSIAEIGLMAWFYVTPIFYPADMAWKYFGERWRFGFQLFVANPMATLVISIRRALFVHGNFAGSEVEYATLWKYLLLCLLLSLAVYGLGRVVFRRLSPHFADEV